MNASLKSAFLAASLVCSFTAFAAEGPGFTVKPIASGYQSVMRMNAMGTTIRVTLVGDSQEKLKTISESIAEDVRRHDALFTQWRRKARSFTSGMQASHICNKIINKKINAL